MSQTGRRDALALSFFALHIAVLIYLVAGWALPGVGFYLLFVPAMVVHWRLNQNTCAINNIESLIRTGRWRDPGNVEEGAWLKTLILDVTGITLSDRQTDRLAHAVLVLLWGLGLWHWFGWPTP